MRSLGVGFVLHPDAEYLSLCRGIVEDEADFYEVSPETLWSVGPSGELSAGPWGEVVESIRDRSRKPLVAHGLALSPGTAAGSPAEAARLARWLARIREDQARFRFEWYTEHLGWVTAEGLSAVLPMPLPPTEDSARTVAGRLALLQPVVPVVGFENQVSYFAFGDTREEASFWNHICAIGDLWILLDLHNAWTQCLNFGVPLSEYLAPLDLSRVIEIHVSGGGDSEAGWLPSGRVMRLDSHDGPVPEPVWRAFEAIRPRCPNLGGVVVERMNRTFGAADVRLLRDEVRRARSIFRGAAC